MSGGSRVTDEMVDAALKSWYLVLTKDKHADMRVALEAALSHQAPAVAVSELEELARGDAGWTSCFGDDEYFVRHSDLRTLINKAGNDEL